MNGPGDVLVTWDDHVLTPEVYGRVRTRNGKIIPFAPFRVSSMAIPSSSLARRNPAGVLGDDGRFLVAWQHESADGDGDGIFARSLCVDLDEDTLCGLDDPCLNVGGQANLSIKPRVRFKKINSDSVTGNDQLEIHGEFSLEPPAYFSNLDPLVDGVRVVVEAQDRTGRVDVAIPGGVYDGIRGWSVKPLNGPAQKYIYRDENRPATNNGIYKLMIQDRSRKASKQVKLRIKGRDGSYPIVAGDEPVGNAK